MKTFLYNIEQGKQISPTIEGQYMVDGMPGNLPQGVVELTITETQPPEYDPATQELTESWTANLVTAQYVQGWEVINLTPEQIALKGWHHPNYCKRIVAPTSLVDQYPNIGVHMWINKLPIEPGSDGSVLYLYMNVIRPEHQALVDSLQGVLTIEDIPVLSNSQFY